FRYLVSGFLQIPVRSGLPSAVLGAGAVRFGFPLGRRGVFGSGTFTHCADAAPDMTRRIAIAAAFNFMALSARGFYGILATVASFVGGVKIGARAQARYSVDRDRFSARSAATSPSGVRELMVRRG